jgi:4'-phosphopantetheinyl transferase
VRTLIVGLKSIKTDVSIQTMLFEVLQKSASKLLKNFESEWSTSQSFELSRSHVDLWRLNLNAPEQHREALRHILNAEEINRADRFHFERDRRRFIAARAQLRLILGEYLAQDPQAITLSYGERGKPHVAEPVAFNISHSEELAVVAVAQERILGVDVEAIRTIEDLEGIARRFFSTRENEVLFNIPVREQSEAFFRCWTLKEAFVKATGDGLAHPTESFDVTFGRGEQAELLSVEGKPDEPSRWKLFQFSPAPNFVGALAVEGQDWELRRFEYEL